MADLADSEFRTVIEDARARHGALVALLHAMDTQAIALLRLYVMMGIATASGTVAGFGQAALISRPVAWALTAGLVASICGALFCLRALRPTSINLPGRNADFWQWALRPDVDRSAVLNAYLDTIGEKTPANQTANTSAAKAIKCAKWCAVAAPVVALLAGIAAYYCAGSSLPADALAAPRL